MGMLDGKVALVTGAGSGMGRLTAETFAEEGARIAALDVSGAQQEVASNIGGSAIALQADVSEEEQVKAAVREVVEQFGGLHVLCNVAGIPSNPTPISEHTLEEFERVMAVNLRGMFLMTKHAVPHMAEVEGGSVVNWASVAAVKPVPGNSAFSISKAGVVQLTRSAAAEYGPQNVRVNALLPGLVKTPALEQIPEEMKPMMDQIIQTTPLRRPGELAEIVATALFLASDSGSYITGVALPVDGGVLLS